MKKNAQSLIEFAVILIVVTIIAVVSLQVISNKINSSAPVSKETENSNITTNEEKDCKEMGLFWDKQNGVCEAR